MELGIYQDVRSAIDQFLIRDVSRGDVSMSEVKTSLDSEPVWSENIAYF